MNAKIRFGIDFFYIMAGMEYAQDPKVNKSKVIVPVLLVLEWGFSTQEQNETTNLFWKMKKDGRLDDYEDVLARLLSHVKDYPDQKARLLSHLMLMANVDGKVTEEEIEFTKGLANVLDVDKVEFGELANRADDIFNILFWYAENHHFMTQSK